MSVSNVPLWKRATRRLRDINFRDKNKIALLFYMFSVLIWVFTYRQSRRFTNDCKFGISVKYISTTHPNLIAHHFPIYWLLQNGGNIRITIRSHTNKKPWMIISQILKNWRLKNDQRGEQKKNTIVKYLVKKILWFSLVTKKWEKYLKM